MLYEMKSRRPGAKGISVVNLSEETIYIGRNELKPGISTPVPALDMIRKTSFVDRLWRNGVIELGATTDIVPEKDSEVAGGEEGVTPLAADTEVKTPENDSKENDTASAKASEDVNTEETIVEKEEEAIEEAPAETVVETEEKAKEESVETVEAPTEADPVQKPKRRKA